MHTLSSKRDKRRDVMNSPRQDAWTKDEDMMLAETVLRYIREGKTQLEAFKEVANKLSRTSAACGFRWNATIRKQYQSAIQLAKEERKDKSKYTSWKDEGPLDPLENESIDKAILILKQMKLKADQKMTEFDQELQDTIKQLKAENERLQKMLLRYDHAWEEMGNLWKWVKENE